MAPGRSEQRHQFQWGHLQARHQFEGARILSLWRVRPLKCTHSQIISSVYSMQNNYCICIMHQFVLSSTVWVAGMARGWRRVRAIV